MRGPPHNTSPASWLDDGPSTTQAETATHDFLVAGTPAPELQKTQLPRHLTTQDLST